MLLRPPMTVYLLVEIVVKVMYDSKKLNRRNPKGYAKLVEPHLSRPNERVGFLLYLQTIIE